MMLSMMERCGRNDGDHNEEQSGSALGAGQRDRHHRLVPGNAHPKSSTYGLNDMQGLQQRFRGGQAIASARV
jgi:hypothetical protein